MLGAIQARLTGDAATALNTAFGVTTFATDMSLGKVGIAAKVRVQVKKA